MGTMLLIAMISIKSNSSYKFVVTTPDGGESIAFANTPGFVIQEVDALGINNSESENTECTTEHRFCVLKYQRR